MALLAAILLVVMSFLNIKDENRFILFFLISLVTYFRFHPKVIIAVSILWSLTYQHDIQLFTSLFTKSVLPAQFLGLFSYLILVLICFLNLNFFGYLFLVLTLGILHFGFKDGGGPYAGIAFLLLLKNIWFYSIYKMYANGKSVSITSPVFSRLRPFWLYLGSNYFPWIPVLNAKRQLYSEIDYKTIVKYLCVFIPFKIGLNYLNFFLHEKPEFSFVYHLSLLSTDAHRFDQWQMFFSVLFHFLVSTIELICWGNYIVLLLMFYGFKLPLNTSNILNVDSFSLFFKKYDFYYREFLIRLFYYPSFYHLKNYSLRFRNGFALFVSLFIGNFFYHLFSQEYLLMTASLLDIFYKSLPMLLYTFLLFIAILFEKRILSFFRNKYLKSCIVLCFFISIHVFYTESWAFSLEEHFKFLYKMLISS